MNHKQLTQGLFKKHFPEWLDERVVEKAMKQTQEEFQKRGVDCRYASLEPKAKRKRWEKRQSKIKSRKAKSSKKSDLMNNQPSLF